MMAGNLKDAVAEDLLKAAEELRFKRESERETLSKSQLKKARRKLTRLYHQAFQQPGAQAGASNMESETADGDLLQPGGVEQWPQASDCQGTAASDFTDASMTGCQQPAYVSRVAVSCIAEEEDISADAQGASSQCVGTETASLTHIDCSSSREPSLAVPTVLIPPITGSILPARPVVCRGARGRHMDMSGVMHALHAHLLPTAQPTIPAVLAGCTNSVHEDSEGSHQRNVRHKPLTATPTHVSSTDPPAMPVSVQAVQEQQQQQQHELWTAPSSSDVAQAAAPPASRDQQHPGNQNQAQAKKRTRNQYIYGNYHGYYGYRHASVGGFESDPRLELLNPSWFSGRHLLDVGCNEGLVTLAAAVRWGPASTTGVDIDAALVGKACRNLRSLRSNVTEQIRRGPAHQPPAAQPQPLVSQGMQVMDQQAQPLHAGVSQPGSCSMDTAAVTGSLLVQAVQPRMPESLAWSEHGAVQVGGMASGPACIQVTSNVVRSEDAAEQSAKEQQQQEQQQQQQQQEQELHHQLLVDQCQAEQQQQQPEQQVLESQQGVAGLAPVPKRQVGAQGLQPGPASTGSWQALRTAARALSAVQFHTQDWANQDDPASLATGRQQQQQQQVQPQAGVQAGQAKPSRVRRQFGVIMCLSVTKWVHLNWGDAGLMRLFYKFNRSLDQGGYLILEPQPWRSYESALVKKHTSGVAVRDLSTLKLRPEGFLNLLVQELGFQMVADLNKSSTAVGFDRPMYVLQKVATGPRLPKHLRLSHPPTHLATPSVSNLSSPAVQSLQQGRAVDVVVASSHRLHDSSSGLVADACLDTATVSGGTGSGGSDRATGGGKASSGQQICGRGRTGLAGGGPARQHRRQATADDLLAAQPMQENAGGAGDD